MADPRRYDVMVWNVDLGSEVATWDDTPSSELANAIDKAESFADQHNNEDQDLLFVVVVRAEP